MIAIADADLKQMVCRDCQSVGMFRREQVEEIVRVDEQPNVAIVKVEGIVCGMCGNTLLEPPEQAKLDAVAGQLAAGQTEGMTAIGVTFRSEA